MSVAASGRIESQVWRIAFVVIVGSIMSSLDTTVVNVALDKLGTDLHKSIANTQWVITGYMLSLAAVIPVTGWAARRFGAKPVYLTSLVLFTLGSALYGLATSTTELVVFRVLQGVGGGMILPIGQLMMAEAAGPKRMGRVMSIVAVPAMATLKKRPTGRVSRSNNVAPVPPPSVTELFSNSWFGPVFVVRMTVPLAMVTASPGFGTSLPEVAGVQSASVVQSPVAPFQTRVAMKSSSSVGKNKFLISNDLLDQC